jgi:hypothetical protein
VVLVWKRFCLIDQKFLTNYLQSNAPSNGLLTPAPGRDNLMLASLSSFTTSAHANITPLQSATILKTFSDASVTTNRLWPIVACRQGR